MYADGQIVHDADRHPGCRGLRLRAFDLLLGDPLHPDVEGDPFGELFAQACNQGGSAIARIIGSLDAVVVLFERAPEREVLERCPLTLRERGKRGLPPW